MPRTLAIAAGAMLLTVAVSAQTPQGQLPQLDLAAHPTSQGLYPVLDAPVGRSYLKPDAALNLYGSIWVRPVEMRFKTPRDSKGYPLDVRALLPDAGAVEQASQYFFDKLQKALDSETSYTLAGEAGLRALELRVGLIDMELNTQAESGSTLAEVLQQVTLVIELRDSITREVLGQAADTRSASQLFDQEQAHEVARERWKRAVDQWALLTARRIGWLGGKSR